MQVCNTCKWLLSLLREFMTKERIFVACGRVLFLMWENYDFLFISSILILLLILFKMGNIHFFYFSRLLFSVIDFRIFELTHVVKIKLLIHLTVNRFLKFFISTKYSSILTHASNFLKGEWVSILLYSVIIISIRLRLCLHEKHILEIFIAKRFWYDNVILNAVF